MPAEREKLLRIERVSKRYGGLDALRNVSFDVAAGEICGIIGPNGAGKSTLFDVISGAVTPSAGRIVLAGEDVTTLPMYRRARRGIARTFQLANTFDTMSVADNVMVGAEGHAPLGLLAGLTHLGGHRRHEAAARHRAATAMELASLSALADVPASRLTFGQQRLVVTARALAAQPRLLMLDEPSAGLSGGDIDHLCAMVLRAREAGATVVVVEHNMDVIMRLCERVVVMHLGEKIGDGTPDSVRQSERVVEAYLGA
jgi:branched-chain amino acid transport system ATP-binding protein